MELRSHQLIIVTLVSTFCATWCLACTITYEQMDTNLGECKLKRSTLFSTLKHLKVVLIYGSLGFNERVVTDWLK